MTFRISQKVKKFLRKTKRVMKKRGLIIDKAGVAKTNK